MQFINYKIPAAPRRTKYIDNGSNSVLCYAIYFGPGVCIVVVKYFARGKSIALAQKNIKVLELLAKKVFKSKSIFKK